MDEDVISVEEAAKLLAVSPSTIRRLFDLQKLEGVRTPGGHRRIFRLSTLQLLDSMKNKDWGITFNS